MGNVETGSLVKDMYGRDTTCRKTSNRFDPHNEARGIVARSTMYAAAMYDFDPEDNFESIETMLKWHLEYSPSANDMRRNDVVYENQHNRNPFVDHPEYACRIWGNESPETKRICGLISPAISISDSELSLMEEETTTLSATTSDGSSINWGSSNPEVVSISDSSSSSGSPITLTALGTGSATISASAVIDDETYEATCLVTVSAKPVKELCSITLSGSYKTSFEINDEFGSDGLIVTANYTIGDSRVLTSQEYTLTAPDMTTAGTKQVNISYSEGGISVDTFYNITISPHVVHVESVSLDKDNLELKIGETFRLTATVLPDDAYNKEVIWSSSNEEVAAVSFMGLVTAKSVGEAIITVTTVDGALKATCKVIVSESKPASGGCGGNIITTSVILSSLSLLGVGILLIKRKFIK